MECEVFLPPGILHPHRDRDTRRFPRARPQDREFLQHDFQIRIVFDQGHHVGQRAFAEAAAIVEELDQRDIAVRIAQRNLMGRGEEGRRVAGDGGAAVSDGF